MAVETEKWDLSQSDCLNYIAGRVENYIDSSCGQSIVCADTLLFQCATDPVKSLAWLEGLLRLWLHSNLNLDFITGHRLYHRYILVPIATPKMNEYRRRILREITVLYVHVQLWYGMVCGIVFCDPNSTTARELVRIHFTGITKASVLFDTPHFHNGTSVETQELHGRPASGRLDQYLHKFESQDPIWLFYDEENFAGKRLAGMRWDNMKKFFGRLYSADMRCYLCNEPIRYFELDHIAPIALGFYQTLLNFAPACKRCNGRKSDIPGYDPFRTRIIVPECVRQCGLERIQTTIPPWMGKLREVSGKNNIILK
jgi:HNH endonuclease